MRYLLAVGLSVTLAGCAATGYQDQPLAKASQEGEVNRLSGMSRRFLSLGQVVPGMSKADISGILGAQVVIGYELTDAKNGQYKPVTVANPYRSEKIAKGRTVLDVDYYLVGIRQADGQVSDDELVPLVYQDDRLLGMGWMFLNEKVKKP